MKTTVPTEFRKNLYQYLDSVIAGESLRIKRKGAYIKISLESEPRPEKLSVLTEDKTVTDAYLDSFLAPTETPWNEMKNL